MCEIDKLREYLTVRYGDDDMSLELVYVVNGLSCYEAVCSGVKYRIEMGKDGEYVIDDTNDLTCNFCASDVELCECGTEKQIEFLASHFYINEHQAKRWIQVNGEEAAEDLYTAVIGNNLW